MTLYQIESIAAMCKNWQLDYGPIIDVNVVAMESQNYKVMIHSVRYVGDYVLLPDGKLDEQGFYRQYEQLK